MRPLPLKIIGSTGLGSFGGAPIGSNLAMRLRLVRRWFYCWSNRNAGPGNGDVRIHFASLFVLIGY
jgi:hypothetical protein